MCVLAMCLGGGEMNKGQKKNLFYVFTLFPVTGCCSCFNGALEIKIKFPRRSINITSRYKQKNQTSVISQRHVSLAELFHNLYSPRAYSVYSLGETFIKGLHSTIYLCYLCRDEVLCSCCWCIIYHIYISRRQPLQY